MRRFSVFGLMGFVLTCGVALAALRNASELWAEILLLVDLGAVGTGLLGVIYLRGKDRAWWLGFNLFGGVYLMLSFAPWSVEQDQSRRVASHLLDYVYHRFASPEVPQTSNLQDLKNARTLLLTQMVSIQNKRELGTQVIRLSVIKQVSLLL